MSTKAFLITDVSIVYLTVCSGADQGGIHWWPANSLHKWPVTRKISPFDDVIMAKSLSESMLSYYHFMQFVNLTLVWVCSLRHVRTESTQTLTLNFAQTIQPLCTYPVMEDMVCLDHALNHCRFSQDSKKIEHQDAYTPFTMRLLYNVFIMQFMSHGKCRLH